MTVASDIAAALAARVATITIAGGYATDIGARVFRGKRRLGEEEVPCTTIVEGDDTLRGDSNVRDVLIAQRFSIEGHTACDAEHPNDAAHLIIGDLKRAVFGGEPKFGVAPSLGRSVKKVVYAGRAIVPREDGTALVAASIDIDVHYVESLDAP